MVCLTTSKHVKRICCSTDSHLSCFKKFGNTCFICGKVQEHIQSKNKYKYKYYGPLEDMTREELWQQEILYNYYRN